MSAARKKKVEEPVQNALGIMGKMAKKDKMSGASFASITQSMDDWRWIDFIDPRTGLPCLLLEWLWGARGLLAGRLLKIEADEGVGKSSYMMMQYAMAQRTANAWCVHAEGEGATAPPDFLASFGVNPDKVMQLKLEKRAIDECFNKLDWMNYIIRRQAKDASDKDIIDPTMNFPIVEGVDSISSFGASQNMEDEGSALSTGTGGLGLHARFLSQWFRDKWSIQENRQVLLMVIAQLREKMNIGGFGGGPPQKKKTTLAATPLNYHASYRLEMRASRLKTADGTQIGENVTFKTTKNKLSPKGKEAMIPLIWNHGFDLSVATIEKLITLTPLTLKNGYVFDIAKSGGGWLSVPALQEKKMQYNVESYSQLCLDVLAQLYANEDLIMSLREAMRIRGFGFDFETSYQPTDAEIADITMTEEQAALATMDETPAPESGEPSADG